MDIENIRRTNKMDMEISSKSMYVLCASMKNRDFPIFRNRKLRNETALMPLLFHLYSKVPPIPIVLYNVPNLKYFTIDVVQRANIHSDPLNKSNHFQTPISGCNI